MEPSPTVPVRRKSAFGSVSLAFALLAVLSPVAAAVYTGYEISGGPGNDPIADGWGVIIALLKGVVAAVALAGLCGLVGTAAGVIALARGEVGLWRPIFALIVNVPVVAFVLYLLLSGTGNGN